MSKESLYYVLTSKCSSRMLLADLPPVGKGAGQSWSEGRLFPEPPIVPVCVKITEEYEEGTILDWFDCPEIMTSRFYKALCSCGIDNIQAYDAYLEPADGSKRYEGFKAVNVIGVVSMASSKTKFWEGHPSKLTDAHIDDMQPNESNAYGIDFFRIAESIANVIVSKRVKDYLETFKFPYLVFRPLKDLVT